MTPDPYPDLLGTDLADLAATGARGGTSDLSEADSRLLAVLSRHAPPVVTAVEDEARAPGDAGAPMSPASRRGPVVPVFQEPTG